MRRARHLVQQLVQALHLPDERVDVVAPAGLPGGRSQPRAFGGMVHRPDDAGGERGCVAPRNDQGIAIRGEDVEQAVGIGRDDRLSHRQRLEGGNRSPLPERRKDAQVEGRQRARHVAAKAGEHESIAEAEPRGLCLELAEERSFADEEEARRRPLTHDLGGGVDEVRIALRIVEARHRADCELAWRDAELARARRRSRPPSATG